MSKGVLLVNLGSPDSTSVEDVRRYLNEFLMDARVIDSPWLLRRLIVSLILINRPKESAHAYEKVWTKEGSPLVVTSRHVQELLQKRVSMPVELAMRYQNPSIESAVKNLAAKDVPFIPSWVGNNSAVYAKDVHGVSTRKVDDLVRALPHILERSAERVPKSRVRVVGVAGKRSYRPREE